MRILFVDDAKEPEHFRLPADTIHAKSYKTAVRALNYAYHDKTPYDTIYLDYDLSPPNNKEDPTGVDVLRHIERNYPREMYPKLVRIISWNAIGVPLIMNMCRRLGINCEDASGAHTYTIINGQSG